MPGAPTPRQIAKDLLNGVRPPRPLFVPLVFELGAKVENLTPDLYRKNPTKIVSALRQMRSPSGSDGVICYFDSALEIEALGGKGVPIESLAAAEELPQRGRIPIATEVIRRMNATPNRDFLLAAGVTGPLALAAQIAEANSAASLRYEEIPDAAKELAGSVATQITNAFLEAGADLILLHELVLPELSLDGVAEWASFLAPAINATRFFEALPVLSLADVASTLANWDAILQHVQDAVICVPLEAAAKRQEQGQPAAGSPALGITLPAAMFSSQGAAENPSLTTLDSLLRSVASPVFLTTDRDFTEAADLRNLVQFAGRIVRAE